MQSVMVRPVTPRTSRPRPLHAPHSGSRSRGCNSILRMRADAQRTRSLRSRGCGPIRTGCLSQTSSAPPAPAGRQVQMCARACVHLRVGLPVPHSSAARFAPTLHATDVGTVSHGQPCRSSGRDSSQGFARCPLAAPRGRTSSSAEHSATVRTSSPCDKPTEMGRARAGSTCRERALESIGSCAARDGPSASVRAEAGAVSRWAESADLNGLAWVHRASFLIPPSVPSPLRPSLTLGFVCVCVCVRV
jgi:hypothetical protein